MLFTLVLFSLLLVSIIGITALIVYKILCVNGVEEITSDRILSDDFKKKLRHLFDYICKKSNHYVLPMVRNIFNSIKGRIQNKHIAFTDRMNGKGDTKYKGAASFFLKNISEHKKATHRDGK